MNRESFFHIFQSGAILLGAYVVGRIITTIVHWSLNRIRAPRAAHLIVTNILWFIVGWISLLTILGTLGLKNAFDLGALGIAVVAFLIQGLVTSIIQGFIIVGEHDFDVGSYITVAGESGTVTDIGLRLTFMTNDDGQQVTVPNSTIYNSGVTKGRPRVAGEEPVAEKTSELTLTFWDKIRRKQWNQEK